jgi:hypothetical protein
MGTPADLSKRSMKMAVTPYCTRKRSMPFIMLCPSAFCF